MKKISTRRKAFYGLLAAAGLMAATPFSAYADSGLDMSTEYPGISVKAGEVLDVDLDISNRTGDSMDVSLSESSLPEGFEGYFSGNGNRISRVHVAPNAMSAGVVYRLTIPDDAAEGTYEIRLAAASDNGLSDVMIMELNITEQEYGQSSFTCEYPQQEGTSGTTFNFNTTLINNGADTQSYSLSAEAPAGWQVSFKPSGSSTQVASLDVDASVSQGMTVSVVPPANVKAGEYSIPVSAISAKENLKMDLQVHITGTYSLALSTPSGLLSLDAKANKASDVTLSVTNNSNVTLSNINLNSAAPTGWVVEFDTSAIETLEPGATAEVVAHITPSDDAMTGDYVTSITASTAETTSTADFRVSVKTSSLWGIAGVLIIVALAAGIGYVFRKYGRR